MANNQKFVNMKNEVANELGVNLSNANILSKDAGKVGGRITQKVFEAYTGKK